MSRGYGQVSRALRGGHGRDAEGESEQPWGVVSDLDLVSAGGTDAMDRTAGGAAATEPSR